MEDAKNDKGKPKQTRQGHCYYYKIEIHFNSLRTRTGREGTDISILSKDIPR